MPSRVLMTDTLTRIVQKTIGVCGGKPGSIVAVAILRTSTFEVMRSRLRRSMETDFLMTIATDILYARHSKQELCRCSQRP
jgi:hypothetical protein